MIKRKGWVSNSSSSSFICDVCGSMSEGDYDEVYYECGHVSCCDSDKDLTKLTLSQKRSIVDYYEQDDKRDDTASEKYHTNFYSLNSEGMGIISEIVVKELAERLDDYYTDEIVEEAVEECDEVPKVFCPVCSLEVISDEFMLSYIINTTNISVEDLKDTIRTKFKTLDEAKKSLK
jgi:hypothetical protein